MHYHLNPPLTPRNGAVLDVLLIGRVSDPKPGEQDERSLGDQERLLREWLSRHTDLDVNVTVVAGSGSGEYLDRDESDQIERAIETGRFDLVLSEDLGRIFRRVHAYLVCELCEDYGTRLIAINDSVDTAKEGWRMAAFFATMRHEVYNADTAKRIRRTLRSRFQQGGVFQHVIFGYVKPEGAKSEDDVRKDPDILDAQQGLQEQQEAVNEQRDALEEERRSIADTRQWESLLAPALLTAGTGLLCLLPLAVAWRVMESTDDADETELNGLLVSELVDERPRALPAPPHAPALPVSAPEPDETQ